MHVREWLPDQPTRVGRSDWPEEGDDGAHLRLRAGHIVVLDRQAWRLLAIDEYGDRQWPACYEKAWREHVELWRHSENLHRANGQPAGASPERSDFYKRPVIVVLRNENFPRSTPKHWCVPASHDWQVLPEHYAVCRACGELPPCRNGEYCWEGGPRQAPQSGGVAFIVPPDCCMGCAEPIRPRMRTVRFPGPNLWYPDLGDGSAIFHARAACADQVDCYRMQWRAEYVAPKPQRNPLMELPVTEGVMLPRTRRSEAVRRTGDWHEQATSGTETYQHGTAGMWPGPSAHTDSSPHADPSPHTGRAFDHGPAAHPEPVAHLPFPAPHAPHAPYAPAAPAEPAQQLPPSPPVAAAPPRQAPSVPPPSTADRAPAEPAQHPEPSEVPGPARATAQDIEAVRRLTAELGISLSRPASHDAEQAARAIEELTTAVRNVALCLNGTGIRPRP